MPYLVVCPLRHVPAVAAEHGAAHLVSLLAPGSAWPERPRAVAEHRHLSLSLHDIAEAQDGHTLAAEADVQRLLGFVRGWDRGAPMLIHCWAGVSRSTAAALIAAATLQPERNERDLARALRAASPTATPNARLVALADAALGRSGRLVSAVAAIGRGADCHEGAPFRLELPAVEPGPQLT